MPKGLVDRSTMEGLAEQTRRLSGTTVKLTPKDAVAILEGLTLSVADDTQTYILVAEDGTEIPAVLVSSETVFDATANDIREGKLAVTDSGVTTGTKVIPSYHTAEGYQIIPAGRKFEFTYTKLDMYDFTKMQCLICPWNTSFSNSVATEKVVINETVYNVLSTDSIATVTKDTESKKVVLGFTNESENLYLIRYFMYKEIY